MRFSFMDPSKTLAAALLLIIGAAGPVFVVVQDAPSALMMWSAGVSSGMGLSWWAFRLSFLAQSKYPR